ncbi:polysaccharide biosynthesis/export protein [Gammaproteobacteria bacterium]
MKIRRNHCATSWSLVGMVALYCVISLFPIVVQADTSSLTAVMTPEQRALFDQLSPEQRDAAIKAIQGLKKDVMSGMPTSSQTEVTPSVTVPVTVIPKPNDSLQPSPVEKEENKVKAVADAKERKPEPEKLKQFGYDLFSGTPTTFAPATDIPVPTDYVIGPGDTIQVQIFGKDNITYSLSVSRDGDISFPAIGPVPVAGMKFSEVRENLMDRIIRQTRGNTANVTMGPLRSIRVLILGEAQQPGSYTISALSTLTNALLVSGGVKTIGSLRNIQLKRNGQNVVTLDLYDLLLRGDTSGDVRLAPGDAIFIPTVGPTVGVSGAVYRPAIYELKDEKSVEDVIKLAGGTLPNVYLQGSQLDRIHDGFDHTVVNLDLSTRKAMETSVRSGDLVRVYSVLERFDDMVTLVGHVHRPGQVQWRRGMHLTDLVRSLKDLLPGSDTSYVVVRRELPDRRIKVLTTDLAQALAHPKSSQNLELKPLDEVLVFGLEEDRVALLAPIITQLTHQARLDKAAYIVSIDSGVRYPGTYPLIQDMQLTDLITAAGGTLPDIDLDFVVVRRKVDKEQRIEVISASLRQAMVASGSSANVFLTPKDNVHLFGLNEDRSAFLTPLLTNLRRQALSTEETPVVEVAGSVLKPGSYPLMRDMRVSDLIRSAGNLSEAAYTLTAEITRYTVVNATAREAAHINIDLAAILNGNQAADLSLKGYDRLNIRPIPKWSEQEIVTVQGEVNFPGVYSISHGETLSNLLHRVGGFTSNAFLEGAVFTREDLRKREQQSIDDLARRMEADLAASVLEKNETGDVSKQMAFSAGKQLVEQLRSTKAVGRLVIDLPGLAAGTDISGMKERNYSELDVVLKNGDQLVVPRDVQEVSVMGEVHHPTSLLYQEGLERDDYISKSGGVTQKASMKDVFVIQASGNVIAHDAAGLFGWLPVMQTRTIRPGDTIVVPFDVERIQPIALWGEVAKITYQLAVSVATLKTLNVF